MSFKEQIYKLNFDEVVFCVNVPSVECVNERNITRVFTEPDVLCSFLFRRK